MGNKRIWSAILTVLLLLSWTLPAMAAGEDQAAAIREYADALEEKYDIRIAYDTNQSGNPAIGAGTLSMMDASLQAVTPAVVRQVSAHFQETIGRKLTFSFVYTPFGRSRATAVEVVGLFVQDYAQIYLLLPDSSNGAFVTGASPLTIIHEFGHALHAVCADKLGAEQLEQEWRALNGGADYDILSILAGYSKTTFVSDYAVSGYDEDFAETFAHAFVRTKAGQGFTGQLVSGGTYTALGNKVLYIENLLQRAFQDAETAAANLHRTFSVPTDLEYRGVLLSGKDLQYIGFSGPLYVRRGTLQHYGIEEESYEWISEVGGWQVEATDGTSYLVFPGSVVLDLTNMRQLAA